MARQPYSAPPIWPAIAAVLSASPRKLTHRSMAAPNESVEATACSAIAEALHKYGCLVVKDPRVEASANETFLDMMERYFEHSDGKTDARPHLHYQVGVTPSEVDHRRYFRMP